MYASDSTVRARLALNSSPVSRKSRTLCSRASVSISASVCQSETHDGNASEIARVRVETGPPTSSASWVQVFASGR